MMRLELPGTPECGTLARALLMGIGHALGWDAELIDDLRTAVTEACNNVVLHAYGAGVGKLVLRLHTEGQWIEAVVCDEGEGLHGVAIDDDRLHVGLPVIGSLAERVEFLSPPDGGTEVHMFFRSSGSTRRERRPDNRRDWGPDPATLNQMLGSWTADSMDTLIGEESLRRGDVVGVVFPATLLGPALGRLIRALAAGNHFRVDRFSKLRELTDVVGAHARAAANDPRLAFAIIAGERKLELLTGPFAPGSGAVLTGEGGASSASPLRELSDELSVESGPRGEILRLVVSDRR